MTKTTKKTSPEEMQQKYMHFQMLQEQIEKIAEQATYLNQRNMDLENTNEALKELAKTKLETEILAPVAEGIFFRSSLKDNQKLIVSVGANTTVEKSISETLEMLSEQKNELTLKIMEAESVMQEMQQQAMKLYQEIEEHVQQA
ncbi:prefoldin subunit alpha [Candidatus Woesearchaeota archaeon]|nr:prefoldin subunit alpha [Candidatus Woesearchaeota archaeon]